MGVLDGRSALITGAGQGIGRGITMRLADAGADVSIAEYNAATGTAVAREIASAKGAAEFIRTDVTRQTDVEGAVAATEKRCGRVDIIVNNAYAGSGPARLEHERSADFDPPPLLHDERQRGAVGHAGRLPSHAPRGLRAHHQPVLAERRQRPPVHRAFQRRQRGLARTDAHSDGGVGTTRHHRQCDLPGRHHPCPRADARRRPGDGRRSAREEPDGTHG